jgi:hypothetical protein
MDTFLTEIDDFLAWEGSQGATLPKVWQHLATVINSGSDTLPPATKQVVWRMMVERPERYRLFCDEKHAGITQPKLEPVDGAVFPVLNLITLVL